MLLNKMMHNICIEMINNYVNELVVILKVNSKQHDLS